jgi:hypothetical protein
MPACLSQTRRPLLTVQTLTSCICRFVRLQRVLVPGAGLGRLPLEIASRGYACQGNEFSYYMLLTRSVHPQLGKDKDSSFLTIRGLRGPRENTTLHLFHLFSTKVDTRA